jgi:hypothetical protein
MSAFEPGAIVTEGEWIKGPDGRLDMDVAIRGKMASKDILMVIECKDYDINKTGKVGRELVDALDSKRLDLGADISMICSNSGFTEDATRKASRKNIGLISVLKMNDELIKLKVFKELYLRRIVFGKWDFKFHFPEGTSPNITVENLDKIRIGNNYLNDWLQQKAINFASRFPFNKEPIMASFAFKEPQEFICESKLILMMKVEVHFSYNIEWFSQVVEIDAGKGFFDHINQRIFLAPIEHNQIVLKDINWEKALKVDPPEPDTVFPRVVARNEVDVAFIKISGSSKPVSEDLFAFDKFVIPEDLIVALPV